jgi:cytochrome oxidase Cu insertion factor (SCO1/SenC/PrrC family)
MGASERVV